MKKRDELLAKHPYKIWKGSDGNWHTYLPDSVKGRVPRKRSTEKALKDMIVEYWKEQEENPTVGEIYKEWVESKLERGEIQKATRDRYNRQYDECFETFGKRRIKNITELEIEDFLTGSIAKHKMTQKAYSNLRTLIYGIFKRAKKRKLITFSITELVADAEISRKSFRKVIKEDNELVFDEEETAKMNEYFRSVKLDIIDLGILLLFKTGLRPGELAGLKKCDVEDNIIKVRRTEIRYKGESGKDVFEVRDFPKTDAGIRDVIVPKNSLWILDEISKKNPFGDFFFELDGKRVPTFTFSKRLAQICEQQDVRRKSLNKIRKTYGSILIDSKVDESTIISQMGHTQIDTTKKYYYKDRKSVKRKAEILDMALAEQPYLGINGYQAEMNKNIEKVQ